MLDREDLAFHNHAAHVQIQFFHGYRIALEGLTVEGFAGGRGLFRLRCTGGNRFCFHQGRPQGFHMFKQCLTFQMLSRFDFDLNRCGKALLQIPLDMWQAFFQFLFSVSKQLNGQIIFFPFPFCACQRATGHGIPLHEQGHQFLIFNLMKFLSRMSCHQIHAAQSIHLCQILGYLIQQTLWNICIRMDRHRYAPALRINIRSNDSRLRKGCLQLLRRLKVRKHIG